MSKPIPKYLLTYYAKLYQDLENGFNSTQAEKILGLTHTYTLITLGKLFRARWLTKEQSPEDARITLYSLKNPTEIISDMRTNK